VLFGLLWVALIGLLWWPFPQLSKAFAFAAGIGLVVYVILLVAKRLPLPRLLLIAIFTIAAINLFLNTAFYPALLEYQSGSKAGKFIAQQALPKHKVFTYNYSVGTSLHFYGQSIFKNIHSLRQLKKGDIILTSIEELRVIDSIGFRHKILLQGEDYAVSRLSFRFLNPKTRDGELKKFVLSQIN
jgi:hypothetical protein